jgi:hypothetical protein
VVALAVAGSVAFHVVAAQRAGSAGEQALKRAVAYARRGDPAAARAQLARARDHFEGARAQLGALGWLPRVGVIDDQLRAGDVLAATAVQATDAALRIADSARWSAVAARGAQRGPQVLAVARRARRAIDREVGTLDGALARLASLPDEGLAGPLARRLRRARRQLARGRAGAVASARDLGALVTFLGGDGPRRYLILSQNPDELRPTGGFIGTYGVLTARDGRVALRRYASIESWYRPRPEAVVPARHAPPALRVGIPVAQTIANVNATPDWPTAARLAARLWRRGGEAPVDGVISFTPDLVARLVRVLGPIRVAGRRVVTSRNVVSLLDYYTHRAKTARGARRKRFVAQLAAEILRRATAGSAPLPALARAIGRGMDAREGMAWTSSDRVRRALSAHRWDGALPDVGGDFFYDAEFSDPTKNGRELTRHFEHDVVLHADRSARITTTITYANDNRLEYPFQSYIALYGPRGARLGPNSDEPSALERAVARHPAAGWYRFAAPWGETSLRVVWDVPDLLGRRGGTLEYRLWWMHVAAHRGDTLRLNVTPPPGWTWAGSPPPGERPLARDLRGGWRLKPVA